MRRPAMHNITLYFLLVRKVLRVLTVEGRITVNNIRIYFYTCETPKDTEINLFI